MLGEKARWELQQNAVCIVEQLEAAHYTQQLYGHLPPITQTIEVRGARHAGEVRINSPMTSKKLYLLTVWILDAVWRT